MEYAPRGGRLGNKYVDIIPCLPNLFLNCCRSSPSHMRLLGPHLLPASCVTFGRSSSITNKSSPHSLSLHPFQAHRLSSQTLEQPVPLSAHSPTRLSYLNQDIASCCISTSRTWVASRRQRPTRARSSASTASATSRAMTRTTTSASVAAT